MEMTLYDYICGGPYKGKVRDGTLGRFECQQSMGAHLCFIFQNQF